VVEELAVERQLQVQLAARESEALGHHRARLLGAGRQRSVLHLSLPIEFSLSFQRFPLSM
jgi:hypothetical protein